MEAKKLKGLVIAALNGAINIYAKNGGKVYPGDKVVDYCIDSTQIADYTYRHPGCIMLYVKLKEGSGCFFLKTETVAGQYIPTNKVFVAWEEDNNMHKLLFECFDNADTDEINKCVENSIPNKLTMGDVWEVEDEFKNIISKTLKQ